MKVRISWGGHAARKGGAMKSKLVVMAMLALLVGAGCSSKSVSPASFEDGTTAPANDAFASAIHLSDVPSQQNADTTSATLESGEPRPCSKINHTVWYAYTPASPVYLLARASGSFSSVIAVYRGTDLTHLTEVGCAATGDTTQLSFQAQRGETYYIQVGGVKNATGTFGLRLDFAQQNALLIGNPGPLPQGWTERELVPDTPVTVAPVGESVPLISVQGSQRASDPDFYDLNISAAGQPLPSIGINAGGALTTPTNVQLVQVAVGGVQAVLRAYYRYDPAQAKCELEVGGTCSVQLPVSAASAAWTASSGPAAELVIQVTLQDTSVDLNGTGANVAAGRTSWIRIPLLGQVTAIGG